MKNVMELFTSVMEKIDDALWGVPLCVLILAIGIFLTIRLRGLQIKHLGKALKFMVKNEEGGQGEISSFSALCVALSATIGTGNIVGVATAIGILSGGPGALFWMWVAAFFGMATKYAEGFLAIKYRKLDKDGKALGGPFYYIQNGMGEKWKWLAKLFAFFGLCAGLLGIGTITQVNGIATAVTNFFDTEGSPTVTIFGNEYSIALVITSIVVAACVGLVVIGGVKRIGKVSQVIVPFMAILYVAVVLIIIIVNIKLLPGAFVEIITDAFGARAATGGIFAAIMIAVQKGVARGIFSNEAGLGSAPIAAAAAQTKEPVRQGLVSMTGTFIDTIVICTMTGLAIVMMGTWADPSLQGVAVTTAAFDQGLYFLPNGVASFILMVCLIFFAFTTILGWDYYGEKCLEYFSNGKTKIVKLYRWLYIFAVFIGPYLTVSVVWTIADVFNALMAIPNVIALFALSGVIVKDTKDFLKRHKEM
ncbi:MAG: sodium:alanine symporter family protein [Parasporobacterium sp.]|nr:sodium:alanine symporter family protein [Parasporobacterium sp.]